MALWSVRSGDFSRDGLSIYQVQELVRSGQIGAEDQASNGGEFRRVREIPPLARLLEAAKGVDEPGTVTVNGLKLKIGADGKPVPPTAGEIARMLSTEAFDREGAAREAKQWTAYAIAAVTGGLLLLAVVILVQTRR